MKTRINYEYTPPSQLIEPFPELRTFPTGWVDLSKENHEFVHDETEHFIVSELDNSTTDAIL